MKIRLRKRAHIVINNDELEFTYQNHSQIVKLSNIHKVTTSREFKANKDDVVYSGYQDMIYKYFQSEHTWFGNERIYFINKKNEVVLDIVWNLFLSSDFQSFIKQLQIKNLDISELLICKQKQIDNNGFIYRIIDLEKRTNVLQIFVVVIVLVLILLMVNIV